MHAYGDLLLIDFFDLSLSGFSVLFECIGIRTEFSLHIESCL